jgi:hypothetical protein
MSSRVFRLRTITALKKLLDMRRNAIVVSLLPVPLVFALHNKEAGKSNEFSDAVMFCGYPEL